MKIEDFKIVEAQMNPTSFAQAIDRGQYAGVLVGFEFEVCVDTEKRRQILAGATNEPGAPEQVPFGEQTLLKFCQNFGRTNNSTDVLEFDKYIEARRPLNESGTTALGATWLKLNTPAYIDQALDTIVDEAGNTIGRNFNGKFDPWGETQSQPVDKAELMTRLKEIFADAGMPVGSEEFYNFAMNPDTSAVRRSEGYRTLSDARDILKTRYNDLQIGSGSLQRWLVKYKRKPREGNSPDSPDNWVEHSIEVVANSAAGAKIAAQRQISDETSGTLDYYTDIEVVGEVPEDPNSPKGWETEQGKQTIVDFNLIDRLWNYLWTYDRLRRIARLDNTEFRRTFVSWVEQRYGLKRMAELVYTGGTVRGQQIPPGLKVVDGKLNEVKNIVLGRNPNWNPNRGSDREGYRGGAEFIKSLLEPIVQRPVHIFTGYHQARKNLTDYYIEPDGSLRPNPGDSSAEVVTPPLPPVEAMRVLNDFYAMARNNGMYTGRQNVTGLHINVSIPATLDVLKLAVFVGDEHVLKSFGRDNAAYVYSIYNSLERRSAPPTDHPNKLKYVQDVAKDIASNHQASTSFETGKYISFRHAGGDYLNDPELVSNTVGRFIRAMIIASDPAAYRNEYLTKVAKLINEMPTHSGRLRRPQDILAARQRMQQLVQHGLRGASAVFFQWDNASSIESLQQGLRGAQPFSIMPDGVFVEPGTEEDRQALAAARGWSRDTKQKLLAAPLDQIKRAQLVFTDQDSSRGSTWSDYGKALGLRDRGNRIGAVVYQPLVLPPSDPRVRTLARQTLSGAVIGPQGTLPESQELDEIDRRGFLRTMGAGAMAAAGVPAAQAKNKQPETIDLLSMGVANKDAEEMLHRAAKAAGIRGVELAQFLAQCWHESYGFKHMQELGDPKYFLRYDPRYEPAKARQLGNIRPGDGERYKGRGFIQITGRDNYRRAGEALGLPLEQRPELASRPDIAARIAIWYWKSRVRPNVTNFNDTRAVTRQINPVMRGLQDRHENFKDYKNVFNV